jgi:REP element-mobilizing transposase RayT
MRRKRLCHEIPDSIRLNIQGEVFFITICCAERGRNQLAIPEVWQIIDDSLSAYEAAGDLKVRLALAMPDHLHALFSFPGNRRMSAVMKGLKSWTAKRGGVSWQRDFFDHRLRSAESGVEKARYIRNNPEWPFQR